jgi:NADP-dependent 3-hydroxy acid dehydrogenase YdfG
MARELEGDVALVTGATSGLGRRFAVVLAEHGAKVALAGRRVERLEEVAAEIRAAGGTCAPVPLDVSDADACIAAVQQAEDELGLVTILVNNAGIPDAQYATKMSIDLIDAVLDTNLRGAFFVSQRAARRMVPLGRGAIINVASTAGLRPGEHLSIYSGS